MRFGLHIESLTILENHGRGVVLTACLLFLRTKHGFGNGTLLQELALRLEYVPLS